MRTILTRYLINASEIVVGSRRQTSRAPNRPNPVGLSIVKLDKVENGKLYIQNIDILDGSPLIDIKPFVPEFDVPENAKAGWLEHTGKTAQDKKSDDRFK
jgi:tRNA (Thr-GGU) A37 N-methylase